MATLYSSTVGSAAQSRFFDAVAKLKKYWLLPIILVLVLFGGLIVLTQGSAVAPFIYTIF